MRDTGSERAPAKGAKTDVTLVTQWTLKNCCCECAVIMNMESLGTMVGDC